MATTSHTFVPLESGDRLTREEFHHRYCARPDIKKAELIQGVVYVASPARIKHHGRPQGIAITWLGNYAAIAPGVEMVSEGSVFLSPDDEVKPDALLYREPPPPGGARLTDDDYLEGPPQLVFEVAASSASYDLHDKLESYRRAGVLEYIVWTTVNPAIIWLSLQDGVYVPLQPDAEGVIESRVFPGLRMPVAAMLAGDRAAVNAALRPPLGPPEST